MGRCARSHAAASSKPGSSRPLMRSRNAVQRSTWRSWKPSGRPRSARPLACQSTLPSRAMPFDELEGQAAPLLQVGVEGRRPQAPGRHRRPAVDEAHQVEGPPEHRRVGADGDGLRVRHVGPAERLDDPPLAHDALVARGGRARRGDAHGAVQVAAAQLVDLVLAAAGDVAVLERRPDPEPLGVEPGRQLVHVGDRRHLHLQRRLLGRAHRFPTSSSRYLAYFALAASCRLGSHCVGQMSSLSL